MGIELLKGLVSQGNSLEIKTKSVKLGLKIQVLISIGYRDTYLSTCYHTPSSAEDHITGSHVLFPMLGVYCILYLLSPLLPRLFFSSGLFLCFLSSPASLVSALCQHQKGCPCP